MRKRELGQTRYKTAHTVMRREGVVISVWFSDTVVYSMFGSICDTWKGDPVFVWSHSYVVLHRKEP